VDPNELGILRVNTSPLDMRGVPMGVIAAQLGHQDTRMTERSITPTCPELCCRHHSGTVFKTQHNQGA
jgi:hypothetical protein